MEYILLVVAAYIIGIGVLISTPNYRSTFLFKVIPVLSGLFLVFYALKQLGWILNI